MKLGKSAQLGGFSLAVVLASAPASARADDCGSQAVSTCINSDTFWPHPGPTRFLGVGGTETVDRGQVGFGLVTTYQSRPVVLLTASPGGGGGKSFAVDNQVTGNFLWQYGVTRDLALDVGLPITLGQSGAGISALSGGASLKSTAVRDLRFGFAYAIASRERISPDAAPRREALGRHFSLAARLSLGAPVGDKSELAGERTVVFVPSLAGDYRRGRFFAGLELGARIRPVTELVGTRVGTQALAGLGLGVDLLKRELLSVQLEARALYNFPEQAVASVAGGATSSTPNGKHIVPSEWMLSVRSAPVLGGDLAFLLGGGGALAPDAPITTPRFRFTLGIVYAPRGRALPKPSTQPVPVPGNVP